MSQITSGLRGVLSNPIVYSAFQNFLGAESFREMLVREFVRPCVGDVVLDIGCGPADILGHLHSVDYWGFDISQAYINQAGKRFNNRGRFVCGLLSDTDLEQMPQFDLVLALGLFHHLDDNTALSILRMAAKALKPGGRLVSFDPCFDAAQNYLARFLVSMDRGQNVRSEQGYKQLAQQVFENPRVVVRHRAWIPYTHCLMECTRK